MAMLARFADCYPFFRKEDTRGDTHPGAMIRDGWEASFMMKVALAHDVLLPLVDGTEVLASPKPSRETGHVPSPRSSSRTASRDQCALHGPRIWTTQKPSRWQTGAIAS